MNNFCKRCGGSGFEPDHAFTGATFRKRRLDAGLTQRQVATSVGCSVQHISDLEQGRRAWNPTLILRYHDALETRVAE